MGVLAKRGWSNKAQSLKTLSKSGSIRRDPWRLGRINEERQGHCKHILREVQCKLCYLLLGSGVLSAFFLQNRNSA